MENINDELKEAKKLTKQEILEALKNKSPLPSYMYHKIVDFAFLTGTRKWGLNIPTSDMDFVLPPDIPFIIEEFKQWSVLPYESFPDKESEQYAINAKILYTIYDGVLLNIIFMRDWAEYFAWWNATHTIKCILSTLPELKESFRERKLRVGIFSAICTTAFHTFKNFPDQIKLPKTEDVTDVRTTNQT